MNRINIYILCLLLSISFNASCGKIKRQKEIEEIVPVKIMTVKRETISNVINYVGNIKGIDEVLVYPKVSGKIIEKVKEEGSPISKGEPIAYIDRDEVGLKFERAPVESPLAGIVGRIPVDIGSYVTPQTPVALVSNVDKVQIDLEISERHLPHISPGQKAEITVDAYPEEKFIGEITKISPIVDLQTRGAPIEIMLENPGHRLHSGMFAKVKLIIEERQNALPILKEAIIGGTENPSVFIVSDGRANLRKIKLGIRQGAYYEVKEGLQEGEKVVIMGQQRLRDGASVKAEE